jgi:hypothetical protein
VPLSPPETNGIGFTIRREGSGGSLAVHQTRVPNTDPADAGRIGDAVLITIATRSSIGIDVGGILSMPMEKWAMDGLQG